MSLEGTGQAMSLVYLDPGGVGRLHIQLTRRSDLGSLGFTIYLPTGPLRLTIGWLQ